MMAVQGCPWARMNTSNPWWPFVSDYMAAEIWEADARKAAILKRMGLKS